MHPPTWVCESLVRQAPLLRLGWAGRAPTHAGELNPGKFCLVSLYPSEVYWNDKKRNQFYHEFWGMTAKQLPYGDGNVKQIVFVHHERGPIFNAKGEGVADWDCLSRIPVYVQDLSLDQVMLGRLVWEIPAARKSVKTSREWQQAESERRDQTARAARNIIDDSAREIAKEMWFNANQTGADSNTSSITKDNSHIAAVKEGREEAILTADDVA